MKRIILVFVALLLGTIGSALGQSGHIAGRVVDPSGAPLAGATVQVIGLPIGVAADAEGRFRMEDVPAGEQVVEARFLGFSAARRMVTVTAEGVELEIVLSSTALDLDQVVVTADRRAQSIRDTPAAITAVSAQMLDQRAATMPEDALAGVPGLFLRHEEASDLSNVSIRGVPNRHQNDTFVALVDGVPYVTGSDEVELNLIVPPVVVDRVEVLRGSTSALYGRGGIAGAINYFTIDAFSQPRVTGSLQAGSYGFFQPSLALALPLVPGKNALLVSGLYEAKEGWRNGTDREVVHLFAKNQWLINDANALTVWAGYLDMQQDLSTAILLQPDGSLLDLPGGIKANQNIDGAEETDELFQATARLETRLSSRVSLTNTVHVRNLNSVFNGGFTEPYSGNGLFTMNGFLGDNHRRVFYAEPQLHARISKGVSVILGGSYEHVSGESTEDWTGEYGFNFDTFEFYFYNQRRDLATGAFINQDQWVTDRIADIDYDADIFGTYAQADIQLVPDRLTAGLGLRYDNFRREAYFAETTTQDGVTPDTTSIDQSGAISPKVSLTWRALPDLTAYATFGQGFSPAFGPVWAFRGRDRSLNSEIGYNYEVGLKGSLPGNQAAFALAAFRLDRRDLLILVPNPGGVSRPENAGRQVSQGIEAEVQFQLGAVVPGLSGWGTYTYLDATWEDFRFAAEFSDTIYDFGGNQVAGAPGHFGSLGLAHETPAIGLRVSAWADVVGDYFYDNPNTVKGGGHALFNSSATLASPRLRGVEVRLAVLNALDETYFHYFGTNDGPFEAYPGRPREVSLGLRYRY
jgi:iron complex outermembrane receptor protein